MKFPKTIALLAGAGLLAGCAAPTLTQLRSQTEELRAARSATNPEQALAMELARPLDAAAAVRVALAGNPAVRATYAQLQVAHGELHQALRPANPLLDLSRLEGGGVTTMAWSVSQPLLDLLFAGYRRTQGELSALETRQQVADELLRLERDVRQAWLRHVAATLRWQIGRRAAEAAEVAAQLAQAYHRAGNLAEHQLRAEQALASEAQLALLARAAERLEARTALLDLLGLRHDQPGLQFDERLMLPATLQLAPDLPAQALRQRLDLAARSAALELAQRESLQASRWRWLSGATLRFEREHETEEPGRSGVGATVPLPFPDSGTGRSTVAAARVELRATALEQQQLAVQNRVAADVQLLAMARRGFEVHARELLDHNRRLLQLTGERHNFMLIGSFELLAARRRQIEAHYLWIDAIERWWRIFNDLSYESGVALPLPDAVGHVSMENLP